MIKLIISISWNARSVMLGRCTFNFFVSRMLISFLILALIFISIQRQIHSHSPSFTLLEMYDPTFPSVGWLVGLFAPHIILLFYWCQGESIGWIIRSIKAIEFGWQKRIAFPISSLGFHFVGLLLYLLSQHVVSTFDQRKLRSQDLLSVWLIFLST